MGRVVSKVGAWLGVVTLSSRVLWVKNMEEKVLGTKSNQQSLGPVSQNREVYKVALAMPSLNTFRPVGHFDQI